MDRSSSTMLLAQIPALTYIVVAKEADWKDYAWIDTLPYVHQVFDGSDIRLYVIDK